MQFDDGKTQWLLTPVKAKAKKGGGTLKSWARRRLLVPAIVLAAYWIGTNSADGTAAPQHTPRPAYTQPANSPTLTIVEAP
ncbi:hypothetical protein PV755_45745 [Streptomyces caniscabiei]|uniref:hypothetical protein n=1 Tax=Streptomyces caniscabiei TaxID=2746961 RepID=UPI0029AAC60F|nr:hypothetical protein [Streptomyces caniscabiei]MDX3516120.1 hypothetical protein [Streptomyces caniscabiei]